MRGTNIGELEEILLLSIATLMPNAYGFAIKEEVENKTGREINLSPIHASLYRLENKGFVSTRFGEATKKRGGKKKKYFELTSRGAAVITESRNIREALWAKVPNAIVELGKLGRG